MEQNAAWQAVNNSINATLKMDQVTAADYPAKVNVVVAGNDLPDFVYNPTTTQPSGVISGLPQFVKAKCADLTPYLSGDAIKDYPNLANLPTYAWRTAVVANAIYGLPVARSNFSSKVFITRPSRVLSATRLIIWTESCFCPKRWMRPMRCSRRAGFQGIS